MTTNPLVSICIPTYNRPEYLRRAVESCLAQTYKNFELIITDNSTDDATAKLAATWTDPRVHYYSNNGNIGPCGSGNRAASLSKGKYIKYLMDDDLLKPCCLELLVKAMEEHPTVGIGMAPMDLVDENDKRIFPKFYVFRKMDYRYRYQVGDGFIERKRILHDFLTRDYPCSVPSGVMMRTEALRRAGKYREEADFAGDLDMCMRIAPEWDFYYVDEVLSSWRLMTVCHTATLHQSGMNIMAFYKVTDDCLANPLVKELFKDDWKKFVRDSLFFCSCRAMLNILAGMRARSPKLIIDTVKTIFREDPNPCNWLRLPFFAIQFNLVSLFPPKLPPARE